MAVAPRRPLGLFRLRTVNADDVRVEGRDPHVVVNAGGAAEAASCCLRPKTAIEFVILWLVAMMYRLVNGRRCHLPIKMNDRRKSFTFVTSVRG